MADRPVEPSSREFKVEKVDGAGGVALYRLIGIVDEHADLGFLARLAGRAQISLKGVRRINSFGVRAWIDAIRKVPADATFEFIECPPPVIDQMNMVSGFLGRGKVSSFFAPMACEACTNEQDVLFNVADCKESGRLPAVACSRCSKPLELDDIEDQYLLFLKD